MDYQFYVNDFDRVQNYAEKYPEVKKIFQYPVAFWFGVKQGKRALNKLEHRVRRLFDRAHPALPVMVLYNLPDRDIGSHSRGGATDVSAYRAYIDSMASAIGDRAPILIYEPDALPHSTLMSKSDSAKRLDLMRESLETLMRKTNAHIYIDIGHSNWLDPEVAGKLLDKVSNDGIRGFSVNVSNYRTTKESVSWAERVRENTHLKHYVVDTSRNGLGPYGNDWCNPPGRALGIPPTTDTQLDHCDAYLWIKIPGESDGECNGGPPAGKFWPEYAQDLVKNTEWIDERTQK